MKYLISIAAIYIAFCALVYFYQSQLVFFPDETSFEQCFLANKENVEIHQGREKKTRYYSIKSKSSNPQGWLIHFHGNGGRACDRYDLVKRFLDMGYHLVLAEYPGYAEKGPLPSHEEILKSGLNVFHDVQKRKEDLPIVLYGESLGAAIATYVSSKYRESKALILQTPMPSVTKIGQHHYPYLPVKYLLNYPFPADKWAKHTSVPTFVFHGTEDEIIPIKFGEEQYQNFPTSNKTFLQIEGAHHNDLMLRVGEDFWRQIESFLSQSNQ